MSAGTVSPASSSTREINPLQLSLEQLNALKTQHEEELSELQRQMESLMNAKGRFLSARNTLDEISINKPGDRLLIPLNASLYVPGQMLETDKVRMSNINVLIICDGCI